METTNKTKNEKKMITCPRCEGNGIIKAFIHYAKGVCFLCNGAKQIEATAEQAQGRQKDIKIFAELIEGLKKYGKNTIPPKDSFWYRQGGGCSTWYELLRGKWQYCEYPDVRDRVYPYFKS